MLISHVSPLVDKPLKTFPAARNHRPPTSTKLYCFVTEAHECKQLAQVYYLQAAVIRTRDLLSLKSSALTITPPSHTKNRKCV